MSKVDLNAEIQYLGNIRVALDQITIKGGDATAFANIQQALENLGRSLNEKQNDINKQLESDTAKPNT